MAVLNILIGAASALFGSAASQMEGTLAEAAKKAGVSAEEIAKAGADLHQSASSVGGLFAILGIVALVLCALQITSSVFLFKKKGAPIVLVTAIIGIGAGALMFINGGFAAWYPGALIGVSVLGAVTALSNKKAAA